MKRSVMLMREKMRLGVAGKRPAKGLFSGAENEILLRLVDDIEILLLHGRMFMGTF